MPDHSSFLTFLLEHIRETLSHNAHVLGQSVIGKHPPTWQSFEPVSAAILVAILLVGLGFGVRSRLADVEEAVIPEDKLTLRTFFEIFLGYFYDLAKSVMDAERAKEYFPLIATASSFVFFANVLALVPGMPVATSSLNVTLGTSLVVFVLFNAYGIQKNGLGYIKHLAGPAWYLAWLVFPIELISLCVRPITLAVRLMLNMAVDHLILGIFLSLVAILVPLPVMFLGIVVVIVQTLVFTLLSCIYIGMATEQEHHEGGEHGHGHAH